jgi:quercetin dioxygenase-like cupin family protein
VTRRQILGRHWRLDAGSAREPIHHQRRRHGNQANWFSAVGQRPADWFTGTVRIDPLFDRAEPAASPARASPSSRAPAPPGTRTRSGRTLIVIAGCGWAQREGGPVEEIRPGDVVWFAPNEKHWHGATATTAMTHIAIQEKLNGKAVDWLEKVSDEQYRR